MSEGLRIKHTSTHDELTSIRTLLESTGTLTGPTTAISKRLQEVLDIYDKARADLHNQERHYAGTNPTQHQRELRKKVEKNKHIAEQLAKEIASIVAMSAKRAPNIESIPAPTQVDADNSAPEPKNVDTTPQTEPEKEALPKEVEAIQNYFEPTYNKWGIFTVDVKDVEKEVGAEVFKKACEQLQHNTHKIHDEYLGASGVIPAAEFTSVEKAYKKLFAQEQEANESFMQAAAYSPEVLGLVGALFNGKNRDETYKKTRLTRKQIHDIFMSRFAKENARADKGRGEQLLAHQAVIEELRAYQRVITQGGDSKKSTRETKQDTPERARYIRDGEKFAQQLGLTLDQHDTDEEREALGRAAEKVWPEVVKIMMQEKGVDKETAEAELRNSKKSFSDLFSVANIAKIGALFVGAIAAIEGIEHVTQKIWDVCARHIPAEKRPAWMTALGSMLDLDHKEHEKAQDAAQKQGQEQDHSRLSVLEQRIAQLQAQVAAAGVGGASLVTNDKPNDITTKGDDTNKKTDTNEDKDTKKPAGGAGAGDDKDIAALPDFDLHAVKKQHVMDTMLLSLVDNHMGGLGEGDRAKYMNNLRSSDVARSLEKLRNRPLWKKVGSFILRSAIPVLVGGAAVYTFGPAVAALLLAKGATVSGAVWGGGALTGALGAYAGRTIERARSNYTYGVGMNFLTSVLYALPVVGFGARKLATSRFGNPDKLIITGDHVRDAAFCGAFTQFRVNRATSHLRSLHKQYDRLVREHNRQKKATGLVNQGIKDGLRSLTKKVQDERASIQSDAFTQDADLMWAQRWGERTAKVGRVLGAIAAGGFGAQVDAGIRDMSSITGIPGKLANIDLSSAYTSLSEQVTSLQAKIAELAAGQHTGVGTDGWKNVLDGAQGAGSNALEGSAGADTLGTGAEMPAYPLPRTATRMFGDTLATLVPGIDTARLQLGTSASPIANVFKSVMSGEDASRLVSTLCGVSEHDLQAYMHRAGLHKPVEVLSAQIPSDWKVDVRGVLQEKMHHGRTVLDTMLRSVDTTANTSPQDKTYIYATLTKLKDALA